jgi:transposase
MPSRKRSEVNPPASDRRATRQERTAPLVESFRRWLIETKAQIMKGSYLEGAVNYALDHWNGLTHFLDDGRVGIDSNTVERALRPLCLTRKNSLFAGNDGGAENWAVTASIVETCKMLGVNVQVYLADVLTKIVQGWPNNRINELMPWEWKPSNIETKAAA